MSVLDFAQGFGAVQMASGMPTPDAPLGAFFHEHSLASETLQYYMMHVGDASRDVSVTVAWYDPPSTVSSYNVSTSVSCVSRGKRTFFQLAYVLVVQKFLWYSLCTLLRQIDEFL